MAWDSFNMVMLSLWGALLSTESCVLHTHRQHRLWSNSSLPPCYNGCIPQAIMILEIQIFKLLNGWTIVILMDHMCHKVITKTCFCLFVCLFVFRAAGACFSTIRPKLFQSMLRWTSLFTWCTPVFFQLSPVLSVAMNIFSFPNGRWQQWVVPWPAIHRRAAGCFTVITGQKLSSCPKTNLLWKEATQFCFLSPTESLTL